MRLKSCLTLALVLLALVGPTPASSIGSPRTLTLSAPAFAQVAHAESAAAGSFLDFEAGMAAYFDTGVPINVAGNQLRNLFRTIETDAPNYLIGAIPLAGYSQSNDVKVFVHASGWVVAYYPRAEPASKVLDFEAEVSTTLTTRFDKVLDGVATAIGASNYQIAYYDFRYPTATHLLLVGESRTGSKGADTFQLNVPSSLPILERSWYVKTSGYPIATLSLDSVTLGVSIGGDSQQGFLTASQLVPDAPHTVSVANDRSYSGDVFGGLAFVY